MSTFGVGCRIARHRSFMPKKRNSLCICQYKYNPQFLTVNRNTMSVFLQGLNRNADDKAVEDLFTNLSVEVTVDRQRNKRFAIVKLADESKLDAAVEGLNGKEFEGTSYGKLRASKYEKRERKEPKKPKKAAKTDAKSDEGAKKPKKKAAKKKAGKKAAEPKKEAGTKGDAFLKRLKRDLKNSGGEKLYSISYDEETDSLVVGLFQRNKAKTLYVDVE